MKIVVSWTEILGTDGVYQVSTSGEVRSFSRYRDGRIRALQDNGHGYMTVLIGKKRLYVHRLVAKAYLENPLELPQVNHKNGIKHDNRVENLEWCTAKQNAKHKYAMGLDSQKGMSNTGRKIGWADVLAIRASSLSCRKIAKVYNLNKDHISRIRTRKVWDYENCS